MKWLIESRKEKLNSPRCWFNNCLMDSIRAPAGRQTREKWSDVINRVQEGKVRKKKKKKPIYSYMEYVMWQSGQPSELQHLSKQVQTPVMLLHSLSDWYSRKILVRLQEAVLQAIAVNPVSSTGRVSGKLIILQSSVVCQLHDPHNKSIRSYQIGPAKLLTHLCKYIVSKVHLTFVKILSSLP